MHSQLLHHITLSPLNFDVLWWSYLLLWSLFHMFTRQSSHMSQWTNGDLTLNNAYHLYTKQVAYHTISYFSSKFLHIYMTGQHYIWTLLLNNTFHMLIKIQFSSTWVHSKTQLENHARGRGPASDMAVSIPMSLCIIQTVGGVRKFRPCIHCCHL